MIKHLKNFLIGLAIGGAMFVPGVSGGTIAVIMGVYDDLIFATSNIFSNFKKSFLFLFPIALGGILGIVTVAVIISKLIKLWEVPMMFFFMGTVVGSIPALLKKATVKSFDLKSVFWILIGFGIILLTRIAPKDGIFDVAPKLNFQTILVFIFAGILISMAFVLPGISTSFMLLSLGIYTLTTDAISTVNLRFLLPLGLSIIFGVLLTVKVLDKLLRKYPKIMYLIICGFVLGSLFEVYPGNPHGMEILFSLLMLCAGATLIYLFSMLNKEEEVINE